MSNYDVAPENDSFFQTEGGVYVPNPTDLKRCVQLGTDKTFTLVEFDTVHDAAKWVSDCIHGKIVSVLGDGGLQFFEATNPIMGEPVLLSMSYLCEVTNIGYTWQDIDAYEQQNVQRRQAKLHMAAQKAAQNPPSKMPRRNGRA